MKIMVIPVLAILVAFTFASCSPCSAKAPKEFSAEVLGSRSVSGMDAIQFLITNKNTTYNVSISLSGGRNISVISNENFFEFINASSAFEVSFPVIVNASKETTGILTLKINYTIHNPANSSFEYRHDSFNFTFNLLPLSVPRIKITAEEIYPAKNFRMYLTNNGGLARNVTVSGNFHPELAVIPAIPPKSTVPLTLYYENNTSGILNVNLSYEFFNGTWQERKECQKILLRFEDKSREVLSLPEVVEVKKGRGNLTFYAFNPYLYPVDLVINSEIFTQPIPIGRLKPGDSKILSVSFETKEKFDLKRVKVNGTVFILSPAPRKERFAKELLLRMEHEPEFEIIAKDDLLANKEQTLEISVKNTGKTANNVVISLEPAFGIALKTKEAFIKELKKGEEKTLKFKVSVGDLPSQSYFMRAKISCDGYEKSMVLGVKVLPNQPTFDVRYFAIVIALLILAILIKKIG